MCSDSTSRVFSPARQCPLDRGTSGRTGFGVVSQYKFIVCEREFSLLSLLVNLLS